MTHPSDDRNDPSSTAFILDMRARALAIVRAMGRNDVEGMHRLTEDLMPALPKVRDSHVDPMGAVMDEARVARVQFQRRQLRALVVAMAAVAEDLGVKAYLDGEALDVHLGEEMDSVRRAAEDRDGQ
jgi:hypothetical protein